jgi:predicted nucleotidyltransferase
MELIKEQKKKIDAIGRKYDLKLVLFFGSRAKGKQRKGSDLDIAVLGNEKIDFRKLLQLNSEFQKVFDITVDVRSLHDATPLFRYQVTKNSQLFYGSSRAYFDYRLFAYLDYIDNKPMFDLTRKMIAKRQKYLRDKIYAG